MEQLKKIGQIKPKSSKDIKFSRISLGFEKLDRNVFDPEKAYDKVAECGVKKARIQSGWQRTEKEKGVYDFAWLDSVVENLVARSIEPWICLCYGNPLYNELAKKTFGAVGCAPITSEEEKAAWINYVKAVVSRYCDRVRYFEVWNEPDGVWCWKHGVNARELGEFTLVTARAVKEVDPTAYTVGGVVCERELWFLNAAFQTGMGKYLDFISFHEYTHDERLVFERVASLSALSKLYNPNIGIIQGESGSQSKSGGHGAVRTGAWTEEIQAKQLARHTMADLLAGVHFTSYFSCMDMIEALNGTVGDTASILDYGYFGILGADFDENGRSTGEYYKKPSYYVLQNICSLFSEEWELCTQPVLVHGGFSERKFDTTLRGYELTSGCFEREGGRAFVYWYPSNIMHTSYQSAINIEIYNPYGELHLIDLMDGTIYELPEKMIEDKGDGVVILHELPVKDTPLVLMLGNFIVDGDRT